MKLFYAPGACSLGIHVTLREVGAPFEAMRVDLRKGEQFGGALEAANPKAKVPTLVRDDGSVLTEYPAIAWWLAAANPGAGLMPEGVEAQARAMEATDYVVSTMHMQGFSRIFRPGNFSPDEAQHGAVKVRGTEIFDKGLALMDRRLDGREWLAGEGRGAYSFADPALFYVSYWRAERLKGDLPPNVARHYAAMKARLAVRAALKAEGLDVA